MVTRRGVALLVGPALIVVNARARRGQRLSAVVFESSLSPSPIRYRFRVAYDGTDFAGWQIQPRARTVQGVIERALTKRFSGQPVTILGASRTDAGVHARGQMAHADLPMAVNTTMLEFQLNRMLPHDVRLFDLEPAPAPTEWQAEQSLQWHAIVNAVGKRYIYRLNASRRPMDPMQRLYRARLGYSPIDLDRLDRALQLCVGKHDFRAFANKRHLDDSIRSTFRRIEAITLLDEGYGDATIVVDLDGALYKMIRNVVGTAVAAARGQLGLDDVAELLEGTLGRADNPAQAAPAHGLTLQAVLYDEGEDDDLLSRLAHPTLLPRRFHIGDA